MKLFNRKEYQREWYLKNRSRILEERKTYAVKNKDKIKEYKKHYVMSPSDREKRNEKARIKYYQGDKQKKAERARKDRLANPDKYKKRSDLYYKNNKEKHRIYAANKHRTDPNARLRTNLRHRIGSALKGATIASDGKDFLHEWMGHSDTDMIIDKTGATQKPDKTKEKVI